MFDLRSWPDKLLFVGGRSKDTPLDIQVFRKQTTPITYLRKVLGAESKLRVQK